MNKTAKASLSLVLCVALQACSSSDDDDEFRLPLDGDYLIEATATTEFDSMGGTCGDAAGTMTLADNELTGTVLSTNGFSLDIQGSVTDSGEVTGGFAQGNNTVATFNGTFDLTSGSGDWEEAPTRKLSLRQACAAWQAPSHLPESPALLTSAACARPFPRATARPSREGIPATRRSRAR